MAQPHVVGVCWVCVPPAPHNQATVIAQVTPPQPPEPRADAGLLPASAALLLPSVSRKRDHTDAYTLVGDGCSHAASCVHSRSVRRSVRTSLAPPAGRPW